jgi:hypothetical protein
MFDINTVFEFSRNHCGAICAFLVPANLLATLQTLVLTGMGRPSGQLWKAAALGNFFAAVMVLHVFTWFIVGVVMLPTYILLFLGCVCLTLNFACVTYRQSMAGFLRALYFRVAGLRTRSRIV